MRGYLAKFFPLGEFRKGIGAGLLGLFVGTLEFLLEFVKPVTLAMRLFGNIYGGEVALGVVTALLIAVFPIALVGLEFLLNFVQALIFSTLTLMFTLIAIEGHTEDHATEHPLGGDPGRQHRTAQVGRAARFAGNLSDRAGQTPRAIDRGQGGRVLMDLIGAGLAALGVIGPGIGIGILTGMTNAAIGRNPDAAGQMRLQFILGAAFAEGLGVLAVVVGLLVIFANPFVGAATP